MRGAGDLIGTAQSGLPRFRIADMERQASLMALAQSDARKLLHDDPQLSGPRGLAALPVGEPTRIGLVRGYRYPTLQPLLDAGRLVREDALDQWAALEKLMRGRTDLAVANDTTLIAFRRRRADSGLRQLAVVDSVQGHCLLGERPGLPAAEIQAAIQRALAKGRVAAVLKPYRS